MAADRTTRSLAALGSASSSRVLNLLSIRNKNAENPAHAAKPLFESPIINCAIILKHRLRADEMDLFSPRRVLGTKLMIPFDKTDLAMGAQSIFVGQRNFETLLRQAGNYRDDLSMKRDIDVLRLLDDIPSLDPFLLREHLRGNDVNPDGCYFEISPADQQRMHDYAAAEISRLTAMANGKSSGNSASTARMVSALLSSEVNERLEPLRATLNLNPEEFCEGVFSWRGFIYYKWCLGEAWPNLIRALKELKAMRAGGKPTPAEANFLVTAKKAILQGAKENNDAIRNVIAVYDNAYASLIDKQDPKLFREFLLTAPALFLEIGDKMGAISHVTSFWSYRFPPGSPKSVDSEELTTIFQDFTKSFGLEIQLAA